VRVAVLFEASGVVRDAFMRHSHDACSVDTRATQRPGKHFQMDAFKFIKGPEFAAADLIIMHYTCTFLTVSGLHWNNRVPGRADKTANALAEVRQLKAACEDAGKLYVFENPVGLIGTHIMPAFDTVQPYEFGHDASKRTCFYGNLAKLKRDPAQRFPGRMVIDPRNGKLVERWSNQTDSGQNKLPPSADRWALRSETYPGIAEAMAEQWGNSARDLFGVVA
jgi:hypothetical protein